LSEHAIGPRAAPVAGGTRHGDVLGGDAMGFASARLLLPPPLPSVRLANAGVRMQVWANVGALLSGAQAGAAVRSVAEGRGWGGAGVAPSASAGVGLVLPLMPGAGLEANYTLAHSGPGADVPAMGLRLQVMG
jgi:hypothetical protein